MDVIPPRLTRPSQADLFLHLTMTDTMDVEDKALALTAKITAAVLDENPERDLREIYQSVIKNGDEADLDPLNNLPHLLPCRDDAASDLLTLMAECGSAKEVIMACQEVVERLNAAPDDDDVDVDEHKLPLAGQVSRILSLYTSAIPRLKLRKSVSETLQPLVPELEPLVSAAALDASVNETRAIVTDVAHFVKTINAWAKNHIHEDDISETARYSTLLTSLLDITLEVCADKVYSSVAQRAFEARFPRLVLRSAVRPDWAEGEKVILLTHDASTSLGRTPSILATHQSIASLVLLAHAPPPDLTTLLPLLTTLTPVLLTSLQSNTALDSTLTLLLLASCPLPASPTPLPAAPVELLLPLTTLLPGLSSVHPDPPTRHLAFRLLAALLARAPRALHLQILADLLSPEATPFPQMRAAAIGLAKDAALAAVSFPATDNDEAAGKGKGKGKGKATADVFASPVFLQTLGPYLFRAHPPELLVPPLPSAQAFLESEEGEPARLVECLAFYYVLCCGTRGTWCTGVRDADTLRSVERSLIGPLRTALEVWMQEVDGAGDTHGHVPWSLAALQMNIERIDEAVKTSIEGYAGCRRLRRNTTHFILFQATKDVDHEETKSMKTSISTPTGNHDIVRKLSAGKNAITAEAQKQLLVD
ncbi:hypothetical protein EVG20_g4242 [Dentipellis fragilis]|uniref:Uncharacterized protein n=1 Tax=Dentipellis fragilis TaxID=205917 RepID=A0A4Y9Z0E4_9AGAM|nr:hypothetical protein EVG20_g4242 [Dentipellis fragilis]